MPSAELIRVTTPEKLQEKCGIVGIFIPKNSILHQFDLGTVASRALWHRGQHGLGFVINTDLGPEKYIRTGTIDQALPAELRRDYSVRRRKSNWALFHTRYGTSGNYDEENLQPILVTTPDGINFSLVHNGEFAINKGMKNSIPEDEIPKGASDTVVVSRLLKYASGNTAEEKIIDTLNKAKGAYSLLIGTDDALFAARDQFGIRPMVIGKYQDGWIITSETHALDKLGIDTIREIKRGEIIKINENGITTLREGSEGKGNFCDLEWAYFSRPDSLNPTHDRPDDSNHPERWLSNFRFREKCGLTLAKESPIPNATMVVGVSDSGVPVGTGYAVGMNLPYRQIILRDHYDQNGQIRTFMKDEHKNAISKMVLGKLSLIPDPRIWKDAVVAVVDDSLIRGSTSKPILKAMFEAGAKEVHLLLGFSKVSFPCHLGVSLRTGKELIANRHNGNEEAIAREINATSVHYISPEGFIRARTEMNDLMMPRNPSEIFLVNGGCGGCITGRYPIDKRGVIYQPRKV